MSRQQAFEASSPQAEQSPRDRDVAAKPSFAQPQQSHGHGDVTARLRQLLGVGRREMLTTDELAREYKFPTAHAARLFVRRWVPFEKRGRRLLVDRRDFDAAMERMGKARRHEPQLPNGRVLNGT